MEILSTWTQSILLLVQVYLTIVCKLAYTNWVNVLSYIVPLGFAYSLQLPWTTLPPCVQFSRGFLSVSQDCSWSLFRFTWSLHRDTPLSPQAAAGHLKTHVSSVQPETEAALKCRFLFRVYTILQSVQGFSWFLPTPFSQLPVNRSSFFNMASSPTGDDEEQVSWRPAAAKNDSFHA